ncbi:MAG: hypothetical protein BGP06_04830 [Rhizobiales bacterium 65-9]|nr:MAG: hypothetical protein BGP06_04830 [Rhizobiales bacterium 65-9]
MSTSDVTRQDELAFRLADICERALESNSLAPLSQPALTSALSSLLRLLAARAQAGLEVDLATGNNRLSATDAVIASTAILESASIEVFELAAWQAMTSTGSSKRARASQIG